MTAPGPRNERARRRLRLVVVGAGTTTVDLLRGLSAIWRVTVIDPDRERLSRAEKVRDLDAIEGDGSSRVVLGLAQLDRADALVAASGDDAVNLEACRLALDAGVVRVAAIANDPEVLADYRDLGVLAYSPDRLAARRVEINLEPGRVSSVPFAEGKAEAVEFRITDDSPMRGRSLAELRSDRWLVAAILREGRVVVPHGATRFQTGDLVTVVGAAADRGLIVRSFISGHARFPADYGRQVVVAFDTADDRARLAEAVQLARSTSVEALLVVHREGEAGPPPALTAELDDLAERAPGLEVRLRAVRGAPDKALISIAGEESVGVVMLAPPAGGRLSLRFKVPAALRRVRAAGVPVLFTRGRDHYERIAVALVDAPGTVAAARAAVDLAEADAVNLLAVAAVPQGGGGRTLRRAMRAAEQLRVEAAAVGVQVKRLVRRGVLSKVLGGAAHSDLVVLPEPPGTPSVLKPTAAGHLLRRLDSSILLVPAPR